MHKKIKILIADDHAIMRDGLAAIIAFQNDMEIIGQACDGSDAVVKAVRLKPDLVLMDMMMPATDGVEATKCICEQLPRTKVLILTSYGDSANLKLAFAHGAVGAITKTMPKEQLVAAIRDVAAGKRVIAPEITYTLSNSDTSSQLTERQLSILHSLSRGLTNKEIAKQFGISTAGIKFHLLTIFRKLDAANRSEAITIALHKHLLNI